MQTMILNEVRTQLLNQGFTEQQYNQILLSCTTYLTPGKPELINADHLKSTLDTQSYRDLSSNVVTTISVTPKRSFNFSMPN